MRESWFLSKNFYELTHHQGQGSTVQHGRDDIPDLGLQRDPFSCLARMKLELFASLGYCGEKERCSGFNLLNRVTIGHAHSLYPLYTSEHRHTQVMFTLRGIFARLVVSSCSAASAAGCRPHFLQRHILPTSPTFPPTLDFGLCKPNNSS